jgi:predicted amidophosphoribosyltransferase
MPVAQAQAQAVKVADPDAVIDCPTCHRPIPAAAEVCPRCGARVPVAVEPAPRKPPIRA